MGIAEQYDLAASLMAIAERSHGRYWHTGWSVQPGSTRDPAELAYTSVHEFCHALLNTTTAYGCLLSTVALLATRETEGGPFRTLLCALAGRSRDTHEAYATFVSLQTRTRGDGEMALALLAGNAEYLRYYRKAEHVAAGLPNVFVRTVAASTVARFCMQTSALQQVLQRGLAQFRLADVRMSEFPDERLTRALRIVTPALWAEAFEEARRQRPDLLRDITPETVGNEAASLARQAPGRLAELSQHLSNCSYRTFAACACRAGLQSLGFNGHQDLLPELARQASELYGEPLPVEVVAPAGPLTDHEQVYWQQFEFERFHVRPDLPRAIVRRYADLSIPEWVEMLPSVAGDGILFVVERTAQSLRDRYSLDGASDLLLRKLPPGPALFLRGRAAPAHAPASPILHYLLTDGLEAWELSLGTQRGYRLAYNVALSAALEEDADWSRRWSQLFQRFPITFLCDLTPESLFHSVDPANVRYLCATIDDRSHCVVVLINMTHRFPYLIPRSAPGAGALLHWLQLRFSSKGLRTPNFTYSPSGRADTSRP